MKRFGVLLLLVLSAGGFALYQSFQPARLEVAAVALGALPPASPPVGMRLSALPTGAMHSQAGFAWRGGAFSEARDFTMAAVLVQHPKGDVLIDTGFGSAVAAQFAAQPLVMRSTSKYTAGTPAAAQLKAAGYDASQLAGIFITHAHWDHVSGLPDFGNVPVLVNLAEQAFIAGDERMSALARSFGALNYRRYGFDSGSYLGYASSHDVWGDGALVVVPTGGHTPGAVTVFVTLPSGRRYAFVGDTVWQREGISLPAERPWMARTLIGEDRDAVRREIGHLHAIQQRFPSLHLMPSHDARAQAELPVFPTTIE